VVDLLDDPALRRAAGYAERAHACERFGLNSSVEATATRLSQLAAQRRDEPRRVSALHEARAL